MQYHDAVQSSPAQFYAHAPIHFISLRERRVIILYSMLVPIPQVLMLMLATAEKLGCTNQTVFCSNL